ncbi:lysozyme inhibitor LprI family protein [Chthonobacter rhizosphaerae]|uniref:lysozyme inhibitor LprI family protein n=1 Tax=Chthonobacter rhizosphaerae TaxID=2735553 RepID=UPI0015EF32B0|nr:lysozyme inhibitor LprI family protein [Chthonobacter rhizosphaerae]
MVRRSLVWGVLGLLVVTMSSASGRAADPSFDCDRPKSEVETLICADEELAALDVELAKAFAAALARSPAGNVQELKLAQGNWMKARNECRRQADMRACALESYRKRLGEI